MTSSPVIKYCPGPRGPESCAPSCPGRAATEGAGQMTEVEDAPADAGAEPAPRRGRSPELMRRLRLAGLAVVVLTLAAVVVTTVVDVAPPSKDDLIRRAGLIGKSELRVGVKDDQPGIAERDAKTDKYSGFD